MFMISERLLPPRGSASRYELLAALSLQSTWQQLPHALQTDKKRVHFQYCTVVQNERQKNGSPVTFHNVSDGETDEKENLGKPVDEH